MSASKYIIETDSTAVKKQIIFSGIFIFSICIITTVLFRSLFNYSNNVKTITLIVLWASMTLFWSGASIITWLMRNKNRYILTNESLVIEQSNLFGSHEKYYRYDSMLSVEVKQNSLSKKSGKIFINIPKLDNQLLLEHVKNPKIEAENIKSRIVNNSTNTESLIN